MEGETVFSVAPEIPHPYFLGLQFRWSWNSWSHWSTENSLSIVAYLNVRGANFFVPGNLVKDGWRNLLRYHPFAKFIPSAHALLAPHHGRERSRL